jgi:hypothetical protein
MIEWFLSPKTDQERSIQYAMKLYGASRTGDEVINHYLERNDKKLDRKLKELQSRKLAKDQGIDWEDYTSDDALDNNLGTSVVRYGLDHSKDMKMPWISVSKEKSDLFKVLKQAFEFQGKSNEHALTSIVDLMKTELQGIKSIAGVGKLLARR